MFPGDNRYLDCVFSLHLLNRDLRSSAFKVIIESGLLFLVFLLAVILVGWASECSFLLTC